MGSDKSLPVRVACGGGLCVGVWVCGCVVCVGLQWVNGA